MKVKALGEQTTLRMGCVNCDGEDGEQVGEQQRETKSSIWCVCTVTSIMPSSEDDN